MQSLEDKPLLAAWILRAKCERFTGLQEKLEHPPLLAVQPGDTAAQCNYLLRRAQTHNMFTPGLFS